jgi:hypothetical protein
LGVLLNWFENSGVVNKKVLEMFYWFHSNRFQIESDNKARIEYIIRYKDHDRLIRKPHANRRLTRTVPQGVEVFYPFSSLAPVDDVGLCCGMISFC